MNPTRELHEPASSVVCWELVALDPQPFRGMTPIRVAHEVAYNPLTPPLPAEAAEGSAAPVVELMQSCWKELPSERPPFDAIATTLAQISVCDLPVQGEGAS